jgi:Plavaka transposase
LHSWQPFTMVFPRANIHKLLASDLLYPVIKGAFKDYIVTWVKKYILQIYPKAQAEHILADINQWLVQSLFIHSFFGYFLIFVHTRIAVIPSFLTLCHFYQGHGFKQWTGDDSKGLMKVCVPLSFSQHILISMSCN